MGFCMNDLDITRIGRRLHDEGLISGNFGNISLRSGDCFCITRAGCYLDNPGKPILVPLEGEVPPVASSEYRVHRQVYMKTAFQAVVHAHPPYAVAASFVLNPVVPADKEGELLCPVIPVVEGPCGSEELAEKVASAMLAAPLVLARGHGSFAAGRDLDQAFQLTALAEHSCKVLHLLGRFPTGVKIR